VHVTKGSLAKPGSTDELFCGAPTGLRRARR
jgi:hypothetical protein